MSKYDTRIARIMEKINALRDREFTTSCGNGLPFGIRLSVKSRFPILNAGRASVCRRTTVVLSPPLPPAEASPSTA